MVYYRINKAGSDKFINGVQLTTVKNELFTEKEMRKNGIPFSYADKVEISKRNIYWFFGARFEIGTFVN